MGGLSVNLNEGFEPGGPARARSETCSGVLTRPVRGLRRGLLLIEAALATISVAVLALLAPSSAKGAARDSYAGEIVKEVEVAGNKRIEKDVLLLKISTQPGKPLDPAVVRQDIHAIMKTGYFHNVAVDVDRVPGGLRVRFHVEERPTIREIKYQGNKKLEVKDLEKAVTLKPNHFFNVAEAKENLEKLRKLYANEGYYSAAIEYEAEPVENNQVVLTFKISENEEVKIRRILFLGNRVFSDKQLSKQIETKKKGLFSFLTSSGVYKEDVLRDDVARLSIFYLNHGYLQCSIEQPMTFRSGNGMSVVFLVEEGDQFRVRSIRLEGVSEEDRAFFSAKQSLKPLEIFNREKLQNDIALMTDYYADQGYAFAEVKPVFSEPDKESKTVDITYEVDKGKHYYIGDIRIKGNTKTRDKVIRRQVLLSEGDRYSVSKLRESKAELNRLGFFDEINLTTQPGRQQDKLDLLVDVKEGQTGTLSGGAGFSSTDKFVLMANVTQSNLFGRAQVLSLNAEIGGLTQNFSLSFTEPWLFDIPLSAGFDVFNTKYDYTDFTRGATGGAARLGYEFVRHLRGHVMYKYEDVNITDISEFAPSIIRSEEGRTSTSSVTFSLVQNTLDNPLLPTKGCLNFASVEIAGTIFGGARNFIKLNLDSGWYFPVVWNTVISVRGRFGLGYGIAGDRFPLFERFFVGGISTVRGFDVRSLGPEVDGQVIGGNKQLIYNLEYLFPLVPQVKLRGLVFFDAGNAFSEDENIRLQSLRLSAGAGFRWFSPLGPLTLVVGFPLDRMAGERPNAVQFSIGTPF